jgi:hypothetical protein
MIVLRVGLEVLGKVDDPLREDRDLTSGEPVSSDPKGVVVDDFLLALGGNRHRQTPSCLTG